MNQASPIETAIRTRPIHEFELIFRFPPGVHEFSEEMVDDLCEAGCLDASIGISNGVPFIAFHRDAPSFRHALTSAIEDVEKAGLGLELVDVNVEQEAQ